MKLGVLVPLNLTATPEFLRALGTTAEKLGFNSLWVGEHVVMVDDYDPNFPVYEDGRMEYEEAADNAELSMRSLPWLTLPRSLTGYDWAPVSSCCRNAIRFTRQKKRQT